MAKYCPNCGVEVLEKEKFCGSCGKKLSLGTNFYTSDERKWEPKDFLKLIAVFIITGFVGFLVILSFESFVQIEMSIAGSFLGIIIGGLCGLIVASSANQKLISKKEVFSSASMFKKSKPYVIISAILFSCLFGFVWFLLVAVSLNFKGLNSIYDYLLLLLPIGAILTSGSSPFLFHSNKERLGAIFFIGNFIAMFTGFLGAFFSDMEIIEMSMPEGLVFGAIMGGLIPAAGATLLTVSNKFIKSLGGSILGGAILGMVGFMYSIQRYVGPQYTFNPQIIEASEIFDIAFIGIILGIIVGGILGYLNFNLGNLRTKMPLAFIGVSALIISPVGFFIGWIYRIINFEAGSGTMGSTVWFRYVTPFGAFLLIVIWAFVGLVAGIATVLLDVKKVPK